ncbi:haloacid dehalogenase-like hydrolase, partial [Candidatus Bathyarchaeota archaeon]|nr:haloacid dehalogenase-like hydrolase [Candidatus Bathyarchaeota archaeon]
MEKSKTNRSRLIVFDVEGVIIPKNRFLFEIGRNLGFLKLVKILIMGLLYETDLLSVSVALKAIFKTLRGIEQDTLLHVLDRLPLMPGVHEVFNNLNRENYKTVLISSGLPTFVVQRLADLVGANYALGFEVGLDNKALTGEIWGDVIESGGKAKVLAQILKDEKLKDEYVVVADDRN